MNYTDAIGRTNKRNHCELCGELPGSREEHHRVEGRWLGKRFHALNLKRVPDYDCIPSEMIGKRICPACYAQHVTTAIDARYNS